MNTDRQLFLYLKQEVQNTFLQNNLVSNPDIYYWKGDDIVKFQEDLFLKTKGRVSEKWFYTYFKSEFEKLPRIDMLNLLSEYVDCSDWEDFKFKCANVYKDTEWKEQPETNATELLSPKKSTPKGESQTSTTEQRGGEKEVQKYASNKKTTLWINYILGASLVFALGVLVFKFFWSPEEKKRYEFCFIDSDTNNRIDQSVIEITLFSAGIPNYGTTSSGCYQFDANLDSILMVVNSPFYKKDSLYLRLSSLSNFTQIELERDDYSIMLDSYSRGDATERAEKLKQIIHPNAKIYRFYEGQLQRELLTRDDYANFLSVPSTSLENLKILQTEKDRQGKITMIKFIIRENEN